MEKRVLSFVVCLAAFTRSASTGSETVWLKDVTKRFEIDKRTLSDTDLPDDLTFHLRRGSDALTLNLKRNYDINSNADVYFVRKLKDGQILLLKSNNLLKEDVAYYQDMENGAYMTVRCVKGSNEECNRVINGNIRIGVSNYDLQPAVTEATSRDLLEVQGILGKRYVLQDQATNSVENKEAAFVNNRNGDNELLALLRNLHRQQKQNHVLPGDDSLSSLNVADSHNRQAKDKSRRSTVNYYVEVAVLIDSSVYDLYSSVVRTSNLLKKREKVKAKIKEVYSHIMNGVDLRYKQIEDHSISITVTLSEFIFFQLEGLFPHKQSKVMKINGKTYIDALHYLEDLFYWDHMDTNQFLFYDQAILFTNHDMYTNSTTNNDILGISTTSGVCVTGERTSVVEANDYSLTVRSAAHELAHALGAVHDGEGQAKDCKAEDLFIMTPMMQHADPSIPYTRNPWIFSNCSIRSFTKTLNTKDCVHDPGMVYNEKEWKEFMLKHLGEVYSLNEQCHLIHGPKSLYCETNITDVCRFMTCTDPKTGKCLQRYFGAARGTKCGDNMWCMEGRCVSKNSR